jgi:hypothetical protein
MKLMIHSVSAVVLLVLFIFLGTSWAGPIEDYASFDRAFIPPLAITQQEKVKPSKKAMKILKPAWSQLKDKYYHAQTSDDTLRKDYDKIEEQILKAEQIVNSGKDLMAAHETLESVRYILMDLRLREGISYYPDILTKFHEYMEEMYHSGADAAPEDLDEDFIYALHSTLKEGLVVWEAVKNAPFNPTEYRFSEKKAQMRKKLIIEETTALKRLEDAISSKDNTKIIKAAKGVKPKYAQHYKLFGDFEKVMPN